MASLTPLNPLHATPDEPAPLRLLQRWTPPMAVVPVRPVVSAPPNDGRAPWVHWWLRAGRPG